MSYGKDLKIDKNNLDEEWIKHSANYMKYVEIAAKADSEAKRAKERLSVIDSELESSIRKEREEQNLKATIPIMESLIKQHPSHIEATNDYIDRLEEARILSGAVDAFASRKHALENLVKLYLVGYFSEPRDIKDDEGESQEEKAVSNSGKKQKDKLNKKRSKK